MHPEERAAGASAPCPACGESTTAGSRAVPDHEYGVAHRATYMRCAGCGSEYQSPMPALDELASFYPQSYHSLTGGGGLLLRMRHDVRVRRLASLLQGDGPVLDYGCGDGGFIRHAAEKLPGRSWYGFEIAPQGEVRQLADGVTLVRGALDDLLAVLPPCHLITMNHVIEHLPQPLETLSRLLARLLPGGVFEGQTPAAGSLEHRVFKSRWSGYHAPRHTVVFSPDGLRRVLARAGLDGVAVQGAFNPAGLALSLASVPHGESAGVIVRQGLPWLGWLGVATLISPLDALSGTPAVVDFAARKPEA